MNIENQTELREAVIKRITAGEDCIAVLREAAEQGDAICQLVYGVNVRNKDWWMKAVNQDCAYACVFAALWNADDDELAAKYFAKAAMKGCLYAQFLWASYLDPSFEPFVHDSSYPMAMKVYKMAATNTAELDEDLAFLVRLRETRVLALPKVIDDLCSTKYRSYAQSSIGCMFRDGRGVERNITEAIAWFEKASADGEKDALFRLGQLYNSDWAGKYMNSDKALSILMPLTDDDEFGALAQFEIGLNYWRRKDYKPAFKWFNKSAMAGNSQAQNSIGACYESGRGVAKDHHKALEWLLLAAKQRHKLACGNIGRFYEYGRGVEKNKRKARKWYLRAVRLGGEDVKDLCRVSRLKMNGEKSKISLSLLNVLGTGQKRKSVDNP